MNFTRTNNGINNLALFHGVDRTVYVEGDGIDQRFWESVFSVFYKGTLSFTFKSIGVRANVEAYAKLIASGQTPNIVAILDSDYEGLKTSILPIKNVLYTYGYSYENDLYTLRQAVILYSSLSNASRVSHYRNLLNRFNVAIKQLSKLTILDFAAQFNNQYVLDKDKKEKTCKLNITNRDEVICSKSIKAVRKSIIIRNVDLSNRPNIFVRRQILNSPKYRWIYGHLWSAVFLRCLSHSLKTRSNITISHEGLHNLAMNNIKSTKGTVFTKNQSHKYNLMINNLS